MRSGPLVFLAFAAAILVVMSAGCADISTTSGTPQLSRDLVEHGLVKGKTTKEQVRAVLGEPQASASSDSTIPGMSAETWTYTKTFLSRRSQESFTRLTNAFSKKVENLEHAVALHYMHYNFCRISTNPCA